MQKGEEDKEGETGKMREGGDAHVNTYKLVMSALSRCHGQTNWINIEIPLSTAACKIKPNCSCEGSAEMTGPVGEFISVSPHHSPSA